MMKLNQSHIFPMQLALNRQCGRVRLGFLLLLLAFSLSAAGIYLWREYQQFSNTPLLTGSSNVTIIFAKGSSADALLETLDKAGAQRGERWQWRMLMRQLASYVFISMLIGDASAIVAVVAENADNIRNLSYSRGLEEDADRHGMERLHARGVDPQGMVELLKLLEEEAMEMPQAMQFLSSHPLTEDRIAVAERERDALGPLPAPPMDLVPLFEKVRTP